MLQFQQCQPCVISGAKKVKKKMQRTTGYLVIAFERVLQILYTGYILFPTFLVGGGRGGWVHQILRNQAVSVTQIYKPA